MFFGGKDFAFGLLQLNLQPSCLPKIFSCGAVEQLSVCVSTSGPRTDVRRVRSQDYLREVQCSFWLVVDDQFLRDLRWISHFALVVIERTKVYVVLGSVGAPTCN
ncbi:hypothetical protein BI330_19770 [Mycobacterium sp. CBMA 623]|nr:hypothetical protein [Mycobacteroides sp. CBMA 326]